MKTPREVAHEILGLLDKDFLHRCGRDGDNGEHYSMCDTATAAIEARDAEARAEVVAWLRLMSPLHKPADLADKLARDDWRVAFGGSAPAVVPAETPPVMPPGKRCTRLHHSHTDDNHLWTQQREDNWTKTGEAFGGRCAYIAPVPAVTPVPEWPSCPYGIPPKHHDQCTKCWLWRESDATPPTTSAPPVPTEGPNEHVMLQGPVLLAACGHVAYREHRDMCIQDGCEHAAYQVCNPLPAPSAPPREGMGPGACRSRWLVGRGEVAHAVPCDRTGPHDEHGGQDDEGTAYRWTTQQPSLPPPGNDQHGRCINCDGTGTVQWDETGTAPSRCPDCKGAGSVPSTPPGPGVGR